MADVSKDAAAIPEGFKQMRPFGGFHEAVGPLWMSKRGDNIIIGMRVEERHCNAIATLHGGMFMTLVDTGFTLAAMRAAPKGQYAVTSSITSDFIAPSRAGDWIEAEVEVLKAGRSQINLDCRVNRKGATPRLLMHASGLFHVVAPSKS